MIRLPPLPAIRVFEAAARHENFTSAARELGMTQAAVSYQIKQLEERLGVNLFAREKRRVYLTEIGKKLAPEVSGAFERLTVAFAQAREDDGAMLTITTTQTFANTWLAWRLGGFQMAHPEIAVRLMVSDNVVDLATEAVDVAIRFAAEPDAGMTADHLFRIDLTPMCSPDFLARHGGKIALNDLLTLPAISPQEKWWPIWLREAGVDVSDDIAIPGMSMDGQSHEGNAAMAGQGIAMLTPFLWRNDLADGKLVRPFAHATQLDGSYWLLVPEHRRHIPKIRRFREWLLSEIGSDLRKLAEGSPPS